MVNISHPYFGDIVIDDLCIWENEILLPEIYNQPIELLLWVDDESLVPTQEFLNQSASHFQAIEKLHQKAISRLIDYLNANRQLMDNYTYRMDDPNLSQLNAIDNHQFTAENFVCLLKLQSVAIWYGYGENHQIIMNYSIDPIQCNELLVVQFDLDGHFKEVAWES